MSGTEHAVCAADEVPETGGLAVDVDGAEVALFRVDGEYYAIDNVCTHQGGPLADGKVEERMVFCPWHGHSFDLETGEHRQLDRLDTETYDVEVRDGTVYVTR